MSWAMKLVTEAIPEAVERNFVREEFSEEEPDWGQFKKQETRDRKIKEWHAKRNERVRRHEQLQNKLLDKAIDGARHDAANGRIVHIGYATDPYGDPLRKTYDKRFVDTGEEEDVLFRLWQRCVITQWHRGRVFSHSGSNFDIRFAWRRSLILGVTMPKELKVIEFVPPTSVNSTFVDIAEVWHAGERNQYTSLRKLARIFLDNIADATDDDKMHALVSASLIFDIARKMRQAGIWKDRETYPHAPYEEIYRDADRAVKEQSV